MANSLRGTADEAAAPILTPVTFNFDLVTNTAPMGTNMTIRFDVPEGPST